MNIRRANASVMGGIVRGLRKAAGQTQAEVAKAAGVKSSRIAHVERGEEIPPPKVLRQIARALEATGQETIEVITRATLGRDRSVVYVEGLNEGQVRRIVRDVERYRRKNGSFGACHKCNAGPFDGCAQGCPDGERWENIGPKYGGSHGR